MIGPFTKTYFGGILLSSGGLLGFGMFLQGAENYIPPPTDMSFMQWVNHFSSGLGVLTSIAMGISGIVFLVLKYLETKRHNKAMEPKDGTKNKNS